MRCEPGGDCPVVLSSALLLFVPEHARALVDHGLIDPAIQQMNGTIAICSILLRV